jgi:hypothetical protein
MKISLIYIIILIFCNFGFSELQWSGRYENSFAAGFQNKESFLQDKNKLRLDLETHPSENIYFKSNLIIEKWFGKTTYKLSSFIPKSLLLDTSLVQTLDAKPITMTDTLYLDNAYVTWQQKRTLVTLGIQPIQWGSGYAWNPTDIWNRKDILDPAYEKNGDMALRLEQGIGMLSLSIISGISEKWRNTPWSAEIKSHIASFDIALTGTRKHDEVNVQSEKYTLGWWFSGQLFDVGVWNETARNNLKDKISGTKERTLQSVTGADYTFGVGNGLYLMSEYLYASDGVSRGKYTVDSWLSYFSGTRLVLGKHNLFNIIRYPFTLTSITLNIITNLSDGSLIVNPWYNIGITSNVDVDIMAAIPVGGKDDQFGRNEYAGSIRLSLFW